MQQSKRKKEQLLRKFSIKKYKMKLINRIQKKAIKRTIELIINY